MRHNFQLLQEIFLHKKVVIYLNFLVFLTFLEKVAKLNKQLRNTQNHKTFRWYLRKIFKKPSSVVLCPESTPPGPRGSGGVWEGWSAFGSPQAACDGAHCVVGFDWVSPQENFNYSGGKESCDRIFLRLILWNLFSVQKNMRCK